jgi:hypothetical protein
MRTLVLVCLISLSAAIFGCSSSDAPAPSASGTAGSAPAPSAGNSGSATSAGGMNSVGGSTSRGGSGNGSGVAGSNPAGGSGGSGTSTGTAGALGSAGSIGNAGSTGSAGAKGNGDGTLGNGDYMGMGTSSKQYYTASDIKRNGQSYVLITNGWGPGFESHTISWNGTSFTVDQMEGKPGSGGQPASYPSVFCGQYSVMQKGDCGLPKAISEMTSLKTGWRWAPNGNENGKYNAAYDIWVGDGTKFTGYLMVWLRDPPNYQPAGSANAMYQGVTVANVEGKWDIWNGTVNGRPIVNWVRHEGSDSHEIEFDVLDFVRDAEMRGLSIPGSTHVRAVAVGFEIWEGPIAGLQSLDFYVNVK